MKLQRATREKAEGKEPARAILHLDPPPVQDSARPAFKPVRSLR